MYECLQFKWSIYYLSLMWFLYSIYLWGTPSSGIGLLAFNGAWMPPRGAQHAQSGAPYRRVILI